MINKRHKSIKLLFSSNQILAFFIFFTFIILALSIALVVFAIIYTEKSHYFIIPVAILGIICVLAGVFVYFRVILPLKKSEMILSQKIGASVDNVTKFDDAINLLIRQQDEARLKSLSLEYLKKEAELNAFQSQINPHFLYNTLESIRGLALLHDVYDVAEMLERLSVLFRNMTKKSNSLITLREELQNIENYMLIQKFRFKNKFEYTIHLPENHSLLMDCKIQNLILQPLVENIFNHAFVSVIRGGLIDIYISSTEKRLIIKISDNGSGIPHQKLSQINNALANNRAMTFVSSNSSKGVALYNINQRIKHQFGEQYGMHIASTANIGTDITINLPIIK